MGADAAGRRSVGRCRGVVGRFGAADAGRTVPLVSLPGESRRAGCSGKTLFVSRAEARDFARKTRSGVAADQRVYSCTWCGYWHLTTMRRGVAKLARKAVRKQVKRERPWRYENPLALAEDCE